MTAYIQDYNNAEDITNDVTVWNATNCGNLTYKVDELQFVLNDLHKYKHTTIISSVKDAWEDESWDLGDGGTYAEDSSNYILNGKSMQLTGDAQWDGIHVEHSLDLTTHDDGYTAGADDLITFFAYITSQNLTDLGSARLAIGFYNDVLGTCTNYYWARFDDQLQAGKNIVKLKKSDFTDEGAPDWSTIRGIDIYLYNAAPDAEVNISVDMILLHGQDFKTFTLKTANETTSTDTTLSNDTHLFVDLPQNGIFEINLNMTAVASNSTPDIQIDWTTSGDITLLTERFCISHGVDVADIDDSSHVKIKSDNSLSSAIAYGLIATKHTYIKEKFVVTTANNGGTLQLRWAQKTSAAGTTAVYAGSYIYVIRLQ